MQVSKRRAAAVVVVVGAFAALAVVTLMTTGPGWTGAEDGPEYRKDRVLQVVLQEVRLGDGVPLDVAVSLRWRVLDVDSFRERFPAPEEYGKLVLQPKARAAAGRVANHYPDVKAVFGAERAKFVADVKGALDQDLAEAEVAIPDVVVSDLGFPETLTSALEQTALKEHELEAVRQESAVALERARSAQQQAEADGKIAIARAEAEGKVAEIAARTEEKQRVTTLARAETEAQVVERKAKADAAKNRLLAQAEADKKRMLAEAGVEEQAKLKAVEVDQERARSQIAVDREKELALLCATNPGYASFLVSKELASKVQIAVLPMGTEAGALGGLLQSMTVMPEKTASKRSDKR